MSRRKGDPGYAGGWCIHYRYNRNLKPGEPDTCEAGVDFNRFKGTKFAVLPCFLDDKTGESRPGAAFCECLRRPTAEEIAVHETWIDARMDTLGTVMQGIMPWRKANKGRSAQEVVECPACKGKLHLSISSYNSHVHGHCETDGCVSWTE